MQHRWTWRLGAAPFFFLLLDSLSNQWDGRLARHGHQRDMRLARCGHQWDGRLARHGYRIVRGVCPFVHRFFLLVGSVVFVAAARAQTTPFATRVIDYDPAPGQFVQDPAFNDPTAALGPPVGGGTLDGDETSVVTLGGFGGSLTLGFDHRVMDDPKNPMGLDFIVFGNAFWVSGDPNRRWAEPATIEISLDVNGNGLADDPWYLIPGSHIANPPAQFDTQTWDDDTSDTTFPPEFDWWVPIGRSGLWQTMNWRLPADPFETSLVLDNPNGSMATDEGIFGYADLSPTLILGDLDGDNIVDDPTIDPASFYTKPDNPFLVGIDPGSGGGDAFDIAWAIDPNTGNAAHLPGFDFLRLTNATNVVFGPLGERSAEIAGVADVMPAIDSGTTRRKVDVMHVAPRP